MAEDPGPRTQCQLSPGVQRWIRMHLGCARQRREDTKLSGRQPVSLEQQNRALLPQE